MGNSRSRTITATTSSCRSAAAVAEVRPSAARRIRHASPPAPASQTSARSPSTSGRCSTSFAPTPATTSRSMARSIPAAELQVFQSGLAINQPGSSFSAQLFQSGLATPEVSLRAGEQFVVRSPTTPLCDPAGQARPRRCTSTATPCSRPPFAVALTGSGLVLTDCNLTIAPISLNFEQIDPGQTVELPVTLTNSGNNPCLINGLGSRPIPIRPSPSPR